MGFRSTVAVCQCSIHSVSPLNRVNPNSPDRRRDIVVLPDAAPPPIERWCDPFDPHADCPAGEACFPFVEYPDPTDDCAQEHYGTICAPEGYGVQGTPCEAGDCAAGYICVLTGQGTQCLQMCDTYGENTCPPGFFCEQIDIQPGLGGCY